VQNRDVTVNQTLYPYTKHDACNVIFLCSIGGHFCPIFGLILKQDTDPINVRSRRYPLWQSTRLIYVDEKIHFVVASGFHPQFWRIVPFSIRLLRLALHIHTRVVRRFCARSCIGRVIHRDSARLQHHYAMHQIKA